MSGHQHPTRIPARPIVGLARGCVAGERGPMHPDTDPSGGSGAEGPVEHPITGELDLHGFRPRDVGSLVPEYLRLCRERGILEVRVVHGRGVGELARSVHAILGRLPEVEAYSLATPAHGGAGATVVRLRGGK